MGDIKKVLRNNNVALVKHMKLDDSLLTHLIQNRILSEANQDEIMVFTVFIYFPSPLRCIMCMVEAIVLVLFVSLSVTRTNVTIYLLF